MKNVRLILILKPGAIIALCRLRSDLNISRKSIPDGAKFVLSGFCLVALFCLRGLAYTINDMHCIKSRFWR